MVVERYNVCECECVSVRNAHALTKSFFEIKQELIRLGKVVAEPPVHAKKSPYPTKEYRTWLLWLLREKRLKTQDSRLEGDVLSRVRVSFLSCLGAV